MPRSRVPPLEAALEVVYAVEAPPERWLADVIGLLGPTLDHGLGVFGYFVDGSRPGPFRIWGLQGPSAAREAVEGWLAMFPDDLKRQTLGRIPYGRGSALFPVWSAENVASASESTGCRDLLGINAVDHAIRGAVFGGYSPHTLGPLPRAVDDYLAVITRHLKRAARIVLADRRSGPARELAAESVEPSLAREALRLAALRAVSELPGASRGRALSAWDDLAHGGLVLLDSFERDGRRYHLAVRLAAAARALDGLSERERDVVRHAAEGLLNKEIAHELGITPSTVGTLLSRAATKVGVGSRLLLIDVWRRVNGPMTGSRVE